MPEEPADSDADRPGSVSVEGNDVEVYAGLSAETEPDVPCDEFCSDEAVCVLCFAADITRDTEESYVNAAVRSSIVGKCDESVPAELPAGEGDEAPAVVVAALPKRYRGAGCVVSG